MTDQTETDLTGPQKAYNIAQSEMFQLAAYGHYRYHPSGEALTDEGKRQQRNYLDRIRAAREQLEATLLRLVAEHAETFRGDWGVPAAWLRSLADDPAALSLLAVRPDERDFDTAAVPAPATDQTALRDLLAEALTAAAFECDGQCGLSEAECFDAHPIVFSAMSNGTTHVHGSVTAIADVVVPLLPATVDLTGAWLDAAAECDKAGGAYAERGANDAAGAAFALMEYFLRRAGEAEYVATPCSAPNVCEDGGEPCSTHERLMAHAEGGHELCAPNCGEPWLRRLAEAQQDRECRASISGNCLREAQSETACATEDGECVYGGQPAREARQEPTQDGEQTALKRAHVALAEQAGRDQAALVRVRQMADYWEQHLPEVIRTPAVVSAIRAALERSTLPTSAASGQPETDEEAVVHACPEPGENGISRCCGRPPCEFVGERVTRDPDKVTCTGHTATPPV